MLWVWDIHVHKYMYIHENVIGMIIGQHKPMRTSYRSFPGGRREIVWCGVCCGGLRACPPKEIRFSEIDSGEFLAASRLLLYCSFEHLLILYLLIWLIIVWYSHKPVKLLHDIDFLKMFGFGEKSQGTHPSVWNILFTPYTIIHLFCTCTCTINFYDRQTF